MSESSPNQQHQDRRDRTYVLMTAAHNEEAFLEKTIASVLSQTVPPQRWVIVSDNSSDRTDEIAESYARKYDFIRFLRVNRTPGRNFRSKVLALQQGVKLLEGAGFEFIGNLDADVSVNPSYFEELIGYFERDPQLGLGAGFIHEERAGRFRNRRSNRVDSVPHAAQLVRRECYKELGGYTVLKHGGEDWYAQTCARKNGWRAEAIPGLPVFHHRHTGAGTGLLRAQYRLGQLDYSFGSDPLFEVLKCVKRFPDRPFVIGGTARLTGFFASYIRREKRPVSPEFIAFLRSEQKLKISALFQHVWKSGRTAPVAHFVRKNPVRQSSQTQRSSGPPVWTQLDALQRRLEGRDPR